VNGPASTLTPLDRVINYSYDGVDPNGNLLVVSTTGGTWALAA